MCSRQLLSSPLLQSLVSLLFFLFNSYAQDAELIRDCYALAYNCGLLRGIRYPFHGDSRPSLCRLAEFQLTCNNEEYSTIVINDQMFRVLSINQSTSSMTIAKNDIWDDTCPEILRSDTILNELLYVYGPETSNISFYYDCPFEIDVSLRNTVTCQRNDTDSNTGFFADESILSPPCGINITVPVLRSALEDYRNNSDMGVRELLNEGFDVEYNIGNTTCLACQLDGWCWNISNCARIPSSGRGLNLGVKLIIGFSAAGGSIFFMCLIFYIYYRRTRKGYVGSYLISRNISSYPSSMTDFEKAGTYLGVHIFDYKELEKATNKFDSDKTLGDGGFGTVYQGKLRDGRVVAVKRLYENNYKRVEQFLNEVEILARLRHQNLVSLYGCTTHRCHELLLVYEYIPNGTVADHLHGERAKPGALIWTTRLNIAIETANALVYLHASDIIHRDVKTNNILLDKNFGVKVADFGLSRLFPTDVTHVSTAPQGTPGYVDPEYHECYQLTDKSDVFSFGVVLVELISSKPAVDITRHRHEINLSNMAVNKIRNHTLHEFVDPNLGFESDYKVRKTVKAVAELAFQCLQNEREMRPSMEEVLEELKGIQCRNYSIEKEDGVTTDDVVLLKNNPEILSPDSVTVKWVSSSTISSASTG